MEDVLAATQTPQTPGSIHSLPYLETLRCVREIASQIAKLELAVASASENKTVLSTGEVIQVVEDEMLQLCSLIKRRETLLSLLQQPYTGESLHFDPQYHRAFATSIAQSVSSLTKVSPLLETLTWQDTSLGGTEMERLMGELSNFIAACQRQQVGMTNVRVGASMLGS